MQMLSNPSIHPMVHSHNVRMHARIQAVCLISQICYGASKDPIGFCKVHVYVHMSKLSFPSWMYYGASNDPTGFRKVHMHVLHVFKLSITYPKWAMVPQRIQQDSIRYTCMHISKLSHPKCATVPQSILQNSLRYMCMHVSKLSVPSQMCYSASKDPTGFCKVHMYACTQANCPIPNVLWCFKGSCRIL